jgi:hypothetical protein
MGLETATYIHELVNTNPVGATDTKAQGDDHIRLLKTTLSNTFPNVEGAVTASHAELNLLDGVTASTAELNFIDGVTSAIQTQIDSKLATNGNGSNVTNLNASNIATGTLAAARLPIVLDQGTYTPTLTAVGNISALAAYVCQYMRVGNVVTVSGLLDVTPTGAGFAQYGISLPIASDFADGRQCGGAGYHGGGIAVGFSADITNNRANARFVAVNNSLQAEHFSFTYLIV